MADSGCGRGTVSDCSLDAVKTNFITEHGRLNRMVTQQIDVSDPLLRLGNKTKRAFPEGMSTVITDVHLTTTVPASSSGGENWDRVDEADCVSSPCCNEPEEIRYGYRKFSGCLSQKAYKTQTFCVVDLTFKHKREQAMRSLMQILPRWTRMVNQFWYRYAFRTNTPSMVLNEAAGNPVTFGDYATSAKPSSALTPDHLDEIYMRLSDRNADLSPFTVQGGVPMQVVLIGHEEFRYLDNLDKEANEGLGARGTDIMVEAFGKMRAIRNFLFIPVPFPTRLGDDGAAYTEIDSHSEVQVESGFESVVNPDYRDPNIAKYTEAIFWNAEAMDWLVAPSFTSPGFRPQDFNGNFQLINFPTDCDPRAKNGYWLAEYMNGAIPNDPNRALTVLSLAVHIRGCDKVPEVCSGVSPASESILPISGCCKVPNFTDQLTFQYENTNSVPVLSAGEEYFLKTQKGLMAKVESIIFDGGCDECYNSIIVVLEDELVAECRTCDPWTELVATSEQVPTDYVAGPDDPCGTAADLTDPTVNTEAPTVVISTDANCHDGSTDFTITVKYSEVVTGGPGTIVTTGEAAIAAAVETVTGTTWTYLVTPTADTDFTADMPAAEVTDAAGNDNTASNSLVVPQCLADPSCPE